MIAEYCILHITHKVLAQFEVVLEVNLRVSEVKGLELIGCQGFLLGGLDHALQAFFGKVDTV